MTEAQEIVFGRDGGNRPNAKAQRGEGARVWDADGRAYIDYVGSWGPLVMGHAYAPAVAAVAGRAAGSRAINLSTSSARATGSVGIRRRNGTAWPWRWAAR